MPTNPDRDFLEQLHQSLGAYLGTSAPHEEETAQLTVDPGADNLKRAIDEAATLAQSKPVQVTVRPGVYRGNFDIPKHGGFPIKYTAPAAALPPLGQQVTPAYEGKLPYLESESGLQTLKVFADDVSFRGLHIGPQARVDYTHIDVMGYSAATPAEVPSRIRFEQMLIRGGALGSDHPGGHRGIGANGYDVAILDSWIDRMMEPGRDSQAVAAWNTPGRILVDNCYLEASGENVMIGGDRNRLGMVPEEIIITRNRIWKDPAWKAVTAIDFKNLLELKYARKVRAQFNDFRYNWADAQTGWSILFTTKHNGYPGPHCLIEDVDFSYNVIRDVSSGFNLSGENGPLQNIRVRHNVWDGLDRATWAGDGRWGLIGAMNARDVDISYNTVLGLSGTVSLYFYPSPDGVKMPGLRITHNVFDEVRYGIKAQASGAAALDEIAVGWEMHDNAIVDDARAFIRWPAGNFLLPVGTVLRTMFDAGYRIVPGSLLSQYITSDGEPLGANPAMLPAVQ